MKIKFKAPIVVLALSLSDAAAVTAAVGTLAMDFARLKARSRSPAKRKDAASRLAQLSRLQRRIEAAAMASIKAACP
jgi:hypothetical protein